MSAFRWIVAGYISRMLALAGLMISLAGCGHHHRQAPAPPPNIVEPPGGPVVPSATPVVPTKLPDGMDTNGPPPELSSGVSSAAMLAARTAAYSKSMESAVNRRAAAGTPGVTAGATPTVTAGATPTVSAGATPTVTVGGTSAATSGQASQVQWGHAAARSGVTSGVTSGVMSGVTSGVMSGVTSGVMPAADPSNAVGSAGNVIASAQSPSAANVAGSVSAGQPSTPLSTPRATPGGDAGAVQMASFPPSGFAGAAIASPSGSLEQRLAERVREYPHDLSAHLDYELGRFVGEQPVPDLTTLAMLPSDDSEMIAAVMDGLSNFRNNLRADPNMLMTQKVAPLLAAADRLRARTGLSIPVVQLCTDVYGFGSYKPIAGDPPHFIAGRESRVILYCEVENFSSELDAARKWQTKLSQNTVLYSDQGVPQWRDNRQPINDVSSSRRHDFFIVQKLTLSPNLASGRYLMKVSVEDTQAQRVAESTIPLAIDASAAGQ